MSGKDGGKAARAPVVEDVFFVALELAERRVEEGFLIAGPAAAVAEAL